MEINIRKAMITDYEDLCLIYSELDELHRTNHPELFIRPEGAARAREYIEHVLSDDTTAIFVAEADAKVVGFAECLVLQSSSFPVLKKREWVQLDNISVKKAYRGRHIGSQLLNKVIEWTKSKGIARIELKVYVFNREAVDFYTRKGFCDLNKTMFLNIEYIT